MVQRHSQGAPDYQAIIKAEILKAPVVVVVWTQNSVHSHPVAQECSQAEKDNKLFQILLDEIEPIDLPMEVKFKAQKTMLLGWTGDTRHPEWLKLNAAIDANLGRHRDAAPPSVTPAERDWERFGIADSKNAEIVAAYIAQYRQSEPLWAAKAKERLAALEAELKRREEAATFAAQLEQEARYRAEGRIRVQAALVRPGGLEWFLPGAGKEESFKDMEYAPEMVLVPAGEFWMGSKDSEGDAAECPRHKVTIPEAFAVGKYPVTVAEYLAGVKAGGCKPPQWLEKGGGYNVETGDSDYYKTAGAALKAELNPIVGISWDDAKAFVAWLTKETGKTYRLLSEAEWEYTCRAGSEAAYCFGDDEGLLERYAWHYANSGKKTHPVGEKLPNAWGLHDVHGNVWEWCEDFLHGDYNGAPSDGSAWIAGNGAGPMLRGASWNDDAGRARCVAQRVCSRVPERLHWFPLCPSSVSTGRQARRCSLKRTAREAPPSARRLRRLWCRTAALAAARKSPAGSAPMQSAPRVTRLACSRFPRFANFLFLLYDAP